MRISGKILGGYEDFQIVVFIERAWWCCGGFASYGLGTAGTVTLKLQPLRQLWLSSAGRTFSLRVQKNPDVVINAKNGDTVAVNGVTLGGSIEDAMADAQHTVMLVTSRIIKRAGGVGFGKV